MDRAVKRAFAAQTRLSGHDDIADIGFPWHPLPMLFASLLATLAPSATAAVAEPKDWPAELAAVADECKVPREQITWVDGAVRWAPPVDGSYDQAKCVLDQLKVRNVPMKQGFVNVR